MIENGIGMSAFHVMVNAFYLATFYIVQFWKVISKNIKIKP